MLTRREFLVASGHILLASSLGRWRLPQSSSVARFAYFSDTHVGLKGNIEQNRQMLAEIKAAQPGWAINGGDVTDYGWRDEYRNWHKLVQDFAVDTVHIPGNHDVRWSPLGPVAFSEVCGPVYGFAERDGVFFGFLDSTVPLSHYGHFEAAMLRDLDRALKQLKPGTPVILATHHWVGRDSVMVDNELDLLKIIEPHNVKLILTGHGHSDLDWQWAGIHCTMNKGLYQFSYEMIEMDRDKGEIRLARRTDKTQKLEPVATIPLASAKRERSRILSLGAGYASTQARLSESAEVRVAGGKWQALPAGAHALPAPVGGWQRVEARNGDHHDFQMIRLSHGLRMEWESALPGGVMSHVMLESGVLYVSAMDGNVIAFDAATGRKRWSAKVGGYCHSSPRVAGDALLVGSSDGAVTCLDAKSGKKRWSAKTAGPVYASATFVGDAAVIASGDGSVIAYDLKTGTQKWKWRLPAGNSSFVQSGLATDGKRVFLGAWNSRLYGLDAATGSEIWSFLTPKSFAYSPAIGDPTVHGDRLYAVANGNALYCLDTASGEKIWEATTPRDKFGYSGPRVVDGIVVAGCLGDLGEVRGVSAADGRELWCTTTGATIYDSSPAVNGRLLAIGSVSGQLNLLEIATGKLVAREMLRPGHFLSTPAMDDKRVYAATYNNYVAAYALPVG